MCVRSARPGVRRGGPRERPSPFVWLVQLTVFVLHRIQTMTSFARCTPVMGPSPCRAPLDVLPAMRSPRRSNGAGAGAARLVRHRVWRPLNVLACWVCITLLLLAELHPCSRHTPTSVFYAYLSQPTARHAYVDLSPLGVPYGLTVRGGFTAPALTRLHPARHARSAIISELRDAKPPTAISSTRGTARTERPLLLVGVFSTAAKRQARMLVRQSLKLQNGAWSRFVEIRFVLGQPDSNEEQRALAEEMDEEGDILLLDERE